jgi:glycosyltransferase involved in cell wall biosynthesis
MVKDNLRLQPWRYLSEVAQGLAQLGHEVTIITDENDDENTKELFEPVSLLYINSVRNPFWRGNTELQAVLTHLAPDIVLWHVGLFSFLYQHFTGPPNTHVIGIFTSPIYRLEQFIKLGFANLVENFRQAGLHLICCLVPNGFLRYGMEKSGLHSLVVQTDTTFRQLIDLNLWSRDTQVITPGVDPAWFRSAMQKNGDLRHELGYRSGDTLVIYYGSPAPIRGLPDLVKAFYLAREHDPSLRLLVLSRRRNSELIRENAALDGLVSSNQYHQDIQIIDGYLDTESLIDHVASADIVALPFKLVPSDAPLAPLEALALGKPVVVTRVASLPELVSRGKNYLVEPADPVSLSQALLKAAQDNRMRGTTNLRTTMRTWKEMAVEWSQLIQAT